MNASDMVANDLKNVCGYYEHAWKCTVSYLLNHTQQSKFN